MSEYRTLGSVPLEVIHKCFLEAFSDYFVKLLPDLAAFRDMNTVRGVDYSASMGLFEAGALAGFTLNGLGNWRGRPTAYDAGTAVVKELRGRGHAGEIFRRLVPVLEGRGLKNYLLEVIDENEGAVKLYKNMGFEVKRRFACMKLAPGAFKPGAASAVEIKDVPPAAWPELRSAMEADDAFMPSWQNSWDSLCRLPGNFAVKAVWDGGRPAGYGVVAPAGGSLPQLWVHSSMRRRGLGTALLAELARSSSGALSWVNIEETRADIIDFLSARGFERGLSQYEMERPLR